MRKRHSTTADSVDRRSKDNGMIEQRKAVTPHLVGNYEKYIRFGSIHGGKYSIRLDSVGFRLCAGLRIREQY